MGAANEHETTLGLRHGKKYETFLYHFLKKDFIH